MHFLGLNRLKANRNVIAKSMPCFYHTIYLMHFAHNNYVCIQIFIERRDTLKREEPKLGFHWCSMPWMMMCMESGSAILTVLDVIFVCRPIIKEIFPFYANQLSAPCLKVIVFRNGERRLSPLTPDILTILSTCVVLVQPMAIFHVQTVSHTHTSIYDAN